MGGREQLEVLLRMGKRVVGDQRGHVRQLCGFCAQEFAARGRVEEEIGDGDCGSARQGGVVHVENFAAGNFDAAFRRASSPVEVSRVTRATEAMEGSASPRKPSVAMESNSSAVRSLEVAWRSKASSASSRFMPLAVVGDANQPSSARLDLDANAGGSGIKRVLEQFLHDRGGPVDHLTGGDLVGHLVGKNTNTAHGERVSVDSGERTENNQTGNGNGDWK